MFTCREIPTYLDVRFDSPGTANALGLTDARALARLIKAHALWTKPVVFRSDHPTVFCAGGNLADHASLKTKAAGLRSNAEIARVLKQFAHWPVPKLAIINGRALGGGVEWLARFDVRWGTTAARLEFRQKQLGLSFGWGGGAAWAEWIGIARVRQLLLEGRALDVHEAHRLGLIDRIVEPNDLEKEIEDWARRISGPVDQVLATWTPRNEAGLFRRLWWGPAHRAALRAWASKS